MKCKGKGDYQDKLDSLTRLKVLHSLSVQPYRYESLRYKTRIQRNRLRLILNDFVEKKMVIRHNYNPIIPWLFPNYVDTMEKKKGLAYYVLDLDNKHTLKWLRDIKLDTFVKDVFKFNLLYPEYRYLRVGTIKTWERCLNYDKYLKNTKINKTKAILKITKTMDPRFSPTLYLPPNQKEEDLEMNKKYSIFTRLKEDNPSKYNEYVPRIEEFESFIRYLNTLENSSERSKELDEILRICKERNLCRFDVLIELSWYFQSREIYFKIWNRLKES